MSTACCNAHGPGRRSPLPTSRSFRAARESAFAASNLHCVLLGAGRPVPEQHRRDATHCWLTARQTEFCSHETVRRVISVHRSGCSPYGSPRQVTSHSLTAKGSSSACTQSSRGRPSNLVHGTSTRIRRLLAMCVPHHSIATRCCLRLFLHPSFSRWPLNSTSLRSALVLQRGLIMPQCSGGLNSLGSASLLIFWQSRRKDGSSLFSTVNALKEP